MGAPSTNTSGTSLTDLILGRMNQDLPDEYLGITQELFRNTIRLGEEGLRQIFQSSTRPLLRTDAPIILPFSNYHDFLEMIYRQRAPSVDKFVRNQGTKEDQRHYKQFNQLFPKKGNPENVGFQDWLQKRSAFIEVAYVHGDKARPSHMIVVRRKDTARMFYKMAERKIRAESRGLTKPLALNDVFGIKIVAQNIEDARALVYDKSGLYHTLMRYGLVADTEKESLMVKGCEVGEQLPGIDNHYDSDHGKDHLIQIGAHSTLGFGRFEIAVTDAAYFLVDEMEHLEYRRKQENIRKRWPKDQIIRFDEHVARSQPLDLLLEPERKRPLVPGQFFPGEKEKYDARMAA
jgi:hypothetical protein